jgi:hypothetical protein
VDLQRLARERLVKRGITIPYCPLWRGPTVLKSRTTTASRPRSRWYESARCSFIAFESA